MLYSISYSICFYCNYYNYHYYNYLYLIRETSNRCWFVVIICLWIIQIVNDANEHEEAWWALQSFSMVIISHLLEQIKPHSEIGLIKLCMQNFNNFRLDWKSSKNDNGIVTKSNLSSKWKTDCLIFTWYMNPLRIITALNSSLSFLVLYKT